MRSDLAVSTVVGALLVLAVIVAGVSLYQLTIVPTLAEEAEAHHADTIARDMADLDAAILTQLQSGSQSPRSTPVSLAREAPVLGPGPGESGSLSFNDRAGSTTISSPNLTVHTRDGEPLLGASGGEWQIVESGETIDEINGVIGLRIKITDASPSDDDRLRIEATDANGDYSGDLEVIVDINPPDLDLIVQTREPPAPGTVIFHNHIISIHRERWDSNFWVDAMLPLYWFNLVLADADKPSTLTFQDDGLDAEYKVSYRKQEAEGLTTVVGAGQPIPDYENTFGGGSIAYETQNEYYPDQTLTIDHGALLREQADGSAFVIDPPFQAKASAEVVQVDLDIAALQGEADTASGTGMATVTTRTSATSSFEAAMGELNITWTSSNPETWRLFLEDELGDAGLTSTNCPPTSPDSACQFEVTTTDDDVHLALHGPHAVDADPSQPEQDVFLHLRRADIDTEVRT